MSPVSKMAATGIAAILEMSAVGSHPNHTPEVCLHARPGTASKIARF
jgi:hypothetical protein